MSKDIACVIKAASVLLGQGQHGKACQRFFIFVGTHAISRDFWHACHVTGLHHITASLLCTGDKVHYEVHEMKIE